MIAEQKLNATLQTRIDVSPTLAIIRVTPDDWTLPDFTPGQFAVIGLFGSAPRCPGADHEDPSPDPTKLIRRAYSIASSSIAKEYLELYIALVPSGALTPRIFELKTGDKLWLSPKITGMFTLDKVPQEKHVVFLSTGTGLAPYMSMIRTSLACSGKRYFAVLHGARHSWDLGYRSELIRLTHTCSNLIYLPTISRPNDEQTGWTGKTGYIQDLWKSRLLNQSWPPSPDNTHIFLCGNPGMIDNMIEILEEEGFKEQTRNTPGEIHVEKYW